MLRFGCFSIVLLLTLAVQIEGSCFAGMLQASPTVDASGKMTTESYCEYRNEKYPLKSNWSYPYPDCLNCQCNTFGLSCCGYGVAAGVIAPPEGCQLAKGTCELKLVKTSDPSKLCFDTETSTSTKAVTKKKKKYAEKRKAQP